MLTVYDFGDPISILGENIWYLWCTKWHKNAYLTRFVYSILPVLFSRGIGNICAEYSPRSPGFSFISVRLDLWWANWQWCLFPSKYLGSNLSKLFDPLYSPYCIVRPDQMVKQWNFPEKMPFCKSGDIGQKCELIYFYCFNKPAHHTNLSM